MTREKSSVADVPEEIDVPHALVRVLEEAGIEYVFGMPGGDMGRIFDALYDADPVVRTILVRHEQTASIMAEMYGRLTGRPGIVMGQGIFLACNALLGALEAVKGSSPMLVLGDFTDMAPFAHHSPYQAGTGEYGNHDLRNLLASVTKYTAAVSEPKQAVQTLQLAIKHATTGSPGPVGVIFSSRAFGATVKAHRPPRLFETTRHLTTGARPAASDVQAVADRLLAAASPVIIAGNGIHAARAWEPLRKLAELLGIPVATTATGKSAMAEVHPLALGVFGNWGQAVANEVVSNADVVLVVGSRLSPTDTCFENPALLDPDRQALLQIDVEPLHVGRHYPVAASIVASADEALADLVRALEPRVTDRAREAARRRGAHVSELKSFHRYFAESEQRAADVPLRPERVLTELSARLGERALVTMDAGTNRLYMTHYFQSRGAGTVYQPSSIGAMGYALPAALAAKLVFPDRDCVAVCGDGGFGMAMNALLTAAQYQLAVVNVVMNNGVLGWVKDGQRRRGNRFIASTLGGHDYARMAQTMGCRGVRVETLEQLSRALDAIPNAKEPTLLDIVVTEEAPFWQVQSPFAKEGPGGE